MFLLVIVASLSLANAATPPLEFNCTGLPNDLAWWGCRSYGECFNDEHIQHDCEPAQAFDQVSGVCVDETVASFPCNRVVDCSALNGTVHRLPELESIGGTQACQFYYTCNYGNFAGHQMCGEGLVYHEGEQNCLSRSMVPPPCGTLGDPA